MRLGLKLFAEENAFDAVLVALSLKCDLPIALVERALADKRLDQLLVFAKSRGAELDTTRAILLMLKLGDINVQRDLFARLQSKDRKDRSSVLTACVTALHKPRIRPSPSRNPPGRATFCVHRGIRIA